MRITQTDRAAVHDLMDCFLDSCDRHYCKTHRLLWRSCETAIKTMEGDREIGLHVIYEMAGCPDCESEDHTRAKHYENWRKNRDLKPTL